MDKTKRGACAVIFISPLTAMIPNVMKEASVAISMEPTRQPGSLGMASVRDLDGDVISISCRKDEAAALAWRVPSIARRANADGVTVRSP